MVENFGKSRFFMKSQKHGIWPRNHVSGLQSGDILVNSLRCRAMFQIIGSAGRVALRHVLLVSCSCGVMAGVVAYVAKQ